MRKFVEGNEAVAIGAMFAGCDVYFGYPITPASDIAHKAAEYFPQLGREFLQAECETGTINMMFGAASTGKLTMTASSGPGISLMQEGMSYLAGAELPAVIVDVMRVGPGLGNIGPEQGDYNQAVKGGGHGNYRTIVLAPASVQEMCDFTIKAFELAYRYRNPAIVLADAVQGQMMEFIKVPEKESARPKTADWALHGDAETRKNLITSIFLDIDLMEKHNQKLQAKYASMQVDADAEMYRTEDAEIILAGYGTCARIARSVVDKLRNSGIKAGMFRPKTLFPFPTKQLNKVAACGKILVVELSNGQFRDDLLLHLDRSIECDVRLNNRMGGNLMKVEDVIASVNDMLKEGC